MDIKINNVLNIIAIINMDILINIMKNIISIITQWTFNVERKDIDSQMMLMNCYFLTWC